MADDLRAHLARVEAKVDNLQASLDHLIAALAEEGDEDAPAVTLDGFFAGAERDQNREL